MERANRVSYKEKYINKIKFGGAIGTSEATFVEMASRQINEFSYTQ